MGDSPPYSTRLTAFNIETLKSFKCTEWIEAAAPDWKISKDETRPMILVVYFFSKLLSKLIKAGSGGSVASGSSGSSGSSSSSSSGNGRDVSFLQSNLHLIRSVCHIYIIWHTKCPRQ
jgi:hypothetical protein